MIDKNAFFSIWAFFHEIYELHYCRRRVFGESFLPNLNAKNSKNSPSFYFLVITFINKEVIVCIIEEAIGAINESNIGGIIAATIF